jgi:hypothetical protein
MSSTLSRQMRWGDAADAPPGLDADWSAPGRCRHRLGCNDVRGVVRERVPPHALVGVHSATSSASEPVTGMPTSCAS